MHIRYASVSDSKDLSALVLKASETVRSSDFTSDGWELLKSTNTSRDFDKRFNADNYFCLLCELDQRIVGYMAVIDYEKIDHMFVLPEYRKQGVCKKLWLKAQEVCVDSGGRGYYWVRSSTYAEPVYKSFGFQPSSDREWSNGNSVRLMKLGEQDGEAER